MSLVTDLPYLIHQLKLVHLKVDDKIASRILSFDKEKSETNDYIKTGASFPNIPDVLSPEIMSGVRQYPPGHVPPRNPLSLRSRRGAAPNTLKTINERPPLSAPESFQESGSKIAREQSIGTETLDNEVKLAASRMNQIKSTKNLNFPSSQPTDLSRTLPLPSVVGIPEIKVNTNLIKDSRRPSAMTVEAPPSRRKQQQQHIIDFCPVPLPVQDQPKVSLLSQLIKSNQTAMDNPFAEEYAVYTGKGELRAIQLEILLPHTNEPQKTLSALVKGDATVAQVIGYILYQYYDEKREPPLDEQQSMVAHWNMHIAEDGEIDEDFPALDRSRQIDQFAFDQFALCEASPSQEKMNQELENKTRKQQAPTPITITQTTSLPVQSQSTTKTQAASTSTRRTQIPISESPSHPRHRAQNAAVPSSFDDFFSALPSPVATSHLIKIQLMYKKGVAHTTTIGVNPTMRLSEIKDMVCRKWRLPSEDYILSDFQTRTEITKHTTLDMLPGVTELSLLKKSAKLTADGVPNWADGLQFSKIWNPNFVSSVSGAKALLRTKKSKLKF